MILVLLSTKTDYKDDVRETIVQYPSVGKTAGMNIFVTSTAITNPPILLSFIPQSFEILIDINSII